MIRYLAALLLFSAPGLSLAKTCQSLDDLSWMAGSWSHQEGEFRTRIQWNRVSPGTAEGTVEVTHVETGEIRARTQQRIALMSGEFFLLMASGAKDSPLTFRLQKCADSEVVFRNVSRASPSHISWKMLESGQLQQEQKRGRLRKTLTLDADLPPRSRKIALSFDDAPRRDSEQLTGMERTLRLVEAFRKHDTPPVLFFSTSKHIDLEGDARLRLYAASGHYIGNHSNTHQRITTLGVDGYLEDVRQAHERLKRYETFVPLYRYPFLDEGREVEVRDALRSGIEALGYRNGYVTVDNYDFYMDSLLQTALRQDRPVDYRKLGEVYVDVLMQAVRFYDEIADRNLDHDPVHVLLLHENDLAAMYMGDLITALRAEGWTLVDALSAYDDPIAYIEPDTLFNGQGRVAAIAETRGVKRRDLVHPLEDTQALDEYFEEAMVFGSPGRKPEALNEDP